MNAAPVIGRRIAQVRQTRVTDVTGKTAYKLDAIVLDNGAEIRFLDLPGDGGDFIFVTGLYVPPPDGDSFGNKPN